MADQSYRLSLAPAARRTLNEAPPAGPQLATAAAMGKFLTGALLDYPQRLGQPLTRELAAYRAVRRGAYRVVYRIDDDPRTVHVVRIDHRAAFLDS